jgi:hypothetical protein
MRILRTILVLLSVLALSVPLATFRAQAASIPPTDSQLLSSCPTSYDPASGLTLADRCHWMTTAEVAAAGLAAGSDLVFQADTTVLSSEALNCTGSVNAQSVGYSEQNGTIDTLGVAVKFEAEANFDFWELKYSVEVSYRHSWISYYTTSDTTTVTALPWSKSWVAVAPIEEQVTGWVQVNFGHPVAGHYVWYVPDTMTGPATDPVTGQHSALIQHTAPMSPAEVNACHTALPEQRLHDEYFAPNADCVTSDGIYSVPRIAACDGQDNQNFVVQPVTNGSAPLVKIWDIKSGNCLDRVGGYLQNATQGDSVHLYPCDSQSPSQLWNQQPVISGGVTLGVVLVNNQTGYCLDAYAVAGGNLMNEPCSSNAANEIFKLT